MTLQELKENFYFKAFNHRETALGFAERSTNRLRVFLGDNNKYWIVDTKGAAKLKEFGYQKA